MAPTVRSAARSTDRTRQDATAKSTKSGLAADFLASAGTLTLADNVDLLALAGQLVATRGIRV